jgi:hypothetical protein
MNLRPGSLPRFLVCHSRSCGFFGFLADDRARPGVRAGGPRTHTRLAAAEGNGRHFGSRSRISFASRSAPQNDGRPSLTASPSMKTRTPCPVLRPRPRATIWRWRRAPPPRRPDVACECKPSGKREHFRRDARGVDNVEFRQRQRSGLVEDDPVDLGKPLDGIARIEQHAGAEHRARHHRLHGRMATPSAQGQVMIRTAAVT